jgi:hypothetical protein
MKRIILVAAALAAILIVLPVGAAKPVPTGTIAIAAGSELFLGDTVTFDYTVSDIGNHDARIEVDCYQAVPFDYTDSNGVTHTQTDPLVYASAAPASDPVVLGGAGSVWLWHGGAAECTATLYYWNNHPSQMFVPLAEVSFSTGG